jgi:mRNA interferase RelE/StbE
MYHILFAKQADKALRRMPRNVSQQIRLKLDQLAENPYAVNNNVTKLQDRPGYRLRVGDWRIIYEIEDKMLRVLVLKIAPRGEVY